MAEAENPPARLQDIDYGRLAGWRGDDLSAAFQAFRRGAAVLVEHPPKRRGLGVDSGALSAILARAASLPADLPPDKARAFFEAEFVPREVLPASGQGFFTGYYEPVVEGSRTRTARFSVPLYRQPDDLVEVDPAAPPAALPSGFRFARTTTNGLAEYPDRAAIEAGFLAGCGLELVWLADPIEAFFIHIQGAARIALAEGGTMRVTYSAKSGHPYTPIGRVLIEHGALERGNVTMKSIKAWLAANRREGAALMTRNRSFIFFREAAVDYPGLGPIAAAKVPLTAGRSLAVDRLLWSFHTPVWIDTTLPDVVAERSFRRLMVAQDTGSAIVGPARGDIFFGSGEGAGALAGAMQAAGRFVVLFPRRQAETIPP